MTEMTQNPTPQPSMGQAVRQLRRARGRTLQELSERSGLSIGYISNIERGAAVPSLRAISRIAEALDRPLSHFMPDTHPQGLITRAGERPITRVGENAKQYEQLHARFPGATFSAYMVLLPPGFQDNDDDFAGFEGEEFLTQMTGRSRCELNGQTYDLNPGDTLHVRSDMRLTVSNPFQHEARVLWVGNPPEMHGRGGS